MTRIEIFNPRRLWLGVGIAASMGILAYLILGDLARLREVVWAIDKPYILAAVVCSIASYFMMGLALWEILALLSYPRPFWEVLGISFVSSTANYLVSSAGVSGFALKAHLLRKRQVPYGTTVLSSVLSTALLYFVLAVIIGQGMIYLMVRLKGTRIAIMEEALGLGVLVVTSMPILLFLFHHRFRGRATRWIFHAVNYGVYSFSKREIPREDFHDFEAQLAQGIGLIRREMGRLTLAIFYTCLDWFFAILVLYFGFRAVGWRLSVAHLSIAFTVGQAATLIPLLPGGLGAMEGAVATSLQGLGVNWEAALVAALVYRFCYHLLPGVASVFILWGLKVSEPRLIEDTVLDTLPAELEREATQLDRRNRHP